MKKNTHRVTRRRAQSDTDAKKHRGPVARFVRGWIMPIAIVLVLQTPLRASVLDWNSVPSGSMRPTILEGERILVNKLAFGLRVPLTRTWITTWGSPERGDIITFASPKDGSRLVKRVIGVPGDRIAMRGNQLFINGDGLSYKINDSLSLAPGAGGVTQPLRLGSELLPGRTHPIALTPNAASRATFPEIVVPDGQFFVMGDNRDQSLDSRYFGFVRRSAIYGRTGMVVTSLDPNNGRRPRFARWFKRLP